MLVKKINTNPEIFTLQDENDKIHTVSLSDDLFESHKCSCENYKETGNCNYIQYIIEYLNNPKEDNIVYFDVETQFSAEEVGGWNNIEKMKVAIAVTYSSREDTYKHYNEEEVGSLIDNLKKASLVVGFNIKRFDYTVIQPYTDFDLNTLPTLDMLEEVQKSLGHRASLDNLAKATLNISKSANGLQSLIWFKRGEIEKIIDYCKQDVKVTKELYIFGKKNGYLNFFNKKTNLLKKVKVNW